MIPVTEILVGDVAMLSPSKMSNLYDLDIEKGTVLEVDILGKRIRVVFNNSYLEHETFFDIESNIKWVSAEHVIDIERDYKIVSLTDNQDTVTNQPVTILNMAKVIKSVSRNEKGYIITESVNDREIENFVFVGVPYDDLEEYEGDVRRISFSKFKAEQVVIDGRNVKAWYYAPVKITDIEDIFVVP